MARGGKAAEADVEVKSAWLVTWEGTSDVPEDPVVAILHHRTSVSAVRGIVERLYISLAYSPREKLLFLKNPRANPYPAEMTLFEHVHCGHNPSLHGRLVSALRVVDGVLKWTEPPSDAERRSRLSR
jgi:hypothetical protein